MMATNADSAAREFRTGWPTGDRIAYGAVHLHVTDIDRAAGFWRDAVGLHERGREDGALHLGTAERDLIVLHEGATGPAPRGAAGLYHVAIHLPDEVAFASALVRLAAARVPQSPTDHIFSKATYANDPDRIMLELTLETTERFGSVDQSAGGLVMYDSEGRRRGGTEPLDVDAALAPLGDRPPDPQVPDGTYVGHVHLHVPDLAAAYAYYGDVIGFERHAMMTAIGMADLGAGGAFPHRIALNDWNGPAARQPDPGAAGMRFFELLVPDRDALARLAERAGVAADADGVLALTDSAGNPIRVAVADGR
jgi:catechol 2,3-dioxygenase